MSWDSSIGALMDFIFMLKISLLLPNRNLYGGPLIPWDLIKYCMYIGVHHNLFIRIVPRTTSTKVTT